MAKAFQQNYLNVWIHAIGLHVHMKSVCEQAFNENDIKTFKTQ